MHARVFSFFLVSLVLLLAGCSNTSSYSRAPQMENLLLAEPAPINPRSQIAIARYSQILAHASLSDEEKAEFLYQRGTLYDSVGLAGLAHYDFSQAISFKPDMAQAYNSIGVHHIQQSEFTQAYEAFDSTLEINPDYDFALLNRGIALYYGGRSDLAVDDLASFVAKDTSDPFRVIWDYFARYEVDPQAANATLKRYYEDVDKAHWAVSLIELFLSINTEADVLEGLVYGVKTPKELTDRLCEAYFYLGKYHSQLGNKGKASNYFKLALSTNVYEYVEHRYARLELSRLRNANEESDNTSPRSLSNP